VVVLDGERREVEVDLVRHTVRVGSREWPIRLGASAPGSVSFEILGERVEVRSEPAAEGSLAGSIAVNGELHSFRVESTQGTASRAREGTAAPGSVRPSASAAPAAMDGPGRGVLPPMPGKVLEVRVHEGEQVRAGQVLLVVEAMKMRNEVTAPIDGAVAALCVTPGTNVTARDVLLRIVGP
jgi:glutaconyl-CoA/methylmalonyl-CoA decarboxylase subunit gamma